MSTQAKAQLVPPPPRAVVDAREAFARVMEDRRQVPQLAEMLDEPSIVGALDACAAASIEVQAIDMSVPGNETIVTKIGALSTVTRREMEKQKDAAMRPLNDKRNLLLGMFRAIDEAIAGVLMSADRKMVEWRRIEADRQRKARELDAAHDAARQDDMLRTVELQEAEERRRLAEAAALETAGKPEEAAVALQEAVEAAPLHSAAAVAASVLNLPPPPPPTPINVKGVKIEGGASATLSDSWDFEVVDPWLVPRQLVKAPEVKRSEALNAIKTLVLLKQVGPDGVPVVAGLRVFPVEKSTFRK